MRRNSSQGNRRSRPLGAMAATGVALLVTGFAVAPPATSVPPTGFASRDSSADQTLRVAADVRPVSASRDDFGATDGAETFIEGGTNHDWAKLVLLSAGWPVTESNVAVMTRWMRQENGPDNWWNRNNPLNNGYGSGGGSGLGSYDSLITAAEMAAENLQNHSGYAAIRSGFAVSAAPAEIERAIWASPWATSHYGNGTHWAYTPVPVIEAPDDAW